MTWKCRHAVEKDKQLEEKQNDDKTQEQHDAKQETDQQQEQHQQQKPQQQQEPQQQHQQFASLLSLGKSGTVAVSLADDGIPTLSTILPPSAKINNQKMITLGLVTHNNIELMKRINRVSLPVSYGDRFYAMVIDNRELCRLAFVCDIPVGGITGRLTFDTGRLSSSSLEHHLTEEEETEVTMVTSPPMLTTVPSLSPQKTSGWELTTGSSSSVVRSKKPIETPTARLCITSLAVLPAYRRSSIGRMLVQWAIHRCSELRDGTAVIATGGIPGLLPGNTKVTISEIYLHVWSLNHVALHFYESMGFDREKVIEGYYKHLTPSDCIVLKKRVP